MSGVMSMLDFARILRDAGAITPGEYQRVQEAMTEALRREYRETAERYRARDHSPFVPGMKPPRPKPTPAPRTPKLRES